MLDCTKTTSVHFEISSILPNKNKIASQILFQDLKQLHQSKLSYFF